MPERRRVEGDRRAGTDRRTGVELRRRLFQAVLVGAYLVLVAGVGLAWLEAERAGDRSVVADLEARTALAQFRAERYASCVQDELDRDREREVRRRVARVAPQLALPPVPPARDCEAEARRTADVIAELVRATVADTNGGG